MSWLLEANDICQKFILDGEEEQVLDSISISVAPSEFVAITGTSGSGKSTLLSVLAGIDQPSSGTINIDGTDITTLSEDQLAPLRNRYVGFVFQAFHLVPSLNVVENVMFPAQLAGDINAKAKAEDLLAKVGLTHRMSSFPKQLSGGEQQRVAICRALINKPAIIFADEPTGNLDSSNSKGVIKLLIELQQETEAALIMATHSKKIAAQADRKLVIHDGRLVAD